MGQLDCSKVEVYACEMGFCKEVKDSLHGYLDFRHKHMNGQFWHSGFVLYLYTGIRFSHPGPVRSTQSVPRSPAILAGQGGAVVAHCMSGTHEHYRSALCGHMLGANRTLG